MKVLTNLLKATFFFIGTFIMAQDTTEQRTVLFNTIDADGNEVITNREMRSFYKGKLNSFGQPIDAKRLFYAFDANRNSIITLNEYVNGPDFKLATNYRDRWQYPERYQEDANPEDRLSESEKAIAKFTRIDTDNDGKITLDEMVVFNQGKIDNITGELINGKLIFYAFDANEDDVVNMEEIMAKPDMKLGYQKLKSNREQLSIAVSEEEKTLTDEEYVNQRITLFFELDQDKNYKISLGELQNYYDGKKDKLGKLINAKLRFYGLDTNEDDSLELEEFTKKIDFVYATFRLKEVEKQ
jgi:Ca2+-binding EF-hand superfamily protein